MGASVGVTVINKDTQAFVADNAVVNAGGGGVGSTSGVLTGNLSGGDAADGFETASRNGLVVQAVSDESLVHVGVAAGFGFGEAVVSSSTSALVADLSELNTLGAGMGMQGTIMDVGHASGPLLAGLLIAHLSYQGAFAVIAMIQVVAAGVFWVLVRR